MSKRTKEQAVLDNIAKVYNPSEDFDLVNTKLALGLMLPDCHGADVLEVGCGTGEMTSALLEVAKSVTVIEPAERYFEQALNRFGSHISLHKEFVEDFKSNKKFDTILLAGLLHHLPDPCSVLRSLKAFLRPDGKVIVTVPHAFSLHRRLGVRAGLLKKESDDTERNKLFRHQHKFDKDTLRKCLTDSGYTVQECFGYMLKPFSSDQMQSLQLSWELIQALNAVGREYQELASQLYIRALPEN